MSRTPSESPERSRSVYTPVRCSRRKLGLPPEHGALPDPAPRRQASQPEVMAQSSFVTLHQSRAPSIFRGEAYEDVEDWLEQFERVAKCNQWSPEQKLKEVYFALDDGEIGRAHV